MTVSPDIRTLRPLRILLIALLLDWSVQYVHAAACGALPQRYQGAMFDAMAQIESGMDAMVLRAVRDAGVSRMALFGRAKVRRSGVASVASLGRKEPGVFVVGAPKSFDVRADLPDSFIRQILSGIKSREYAFVGEILFTHGDKAHGEQTGDGERYVDPAAPGTRLLLDGLKGTGAPIMAHWEVYDWKRDWPQFHEIYSAYADQVFIWPHAGFGSAAQLETVLAAHPNVVATLSKKEKRSLALSAKEKADLLGEAIVDGCGKLLPEWQALIVKYQDRLMFATDAHKDFRWRQYGQIVEQWRHILSQLPPDAAKAVAYSNAERLYGGARKSVN